MESGYYIPRMGKRPYKDTLPPPTKSRGGGMVVSPNIQIQTNKIHTKWISVLSLFLYTRRIDFYKELHLVFLVDGLPDILFNELMALTKAGTMQLQYKLTEKAQLLDKDFGKGEMEIVTIRDREEVIKEKVENIMALDIAMLQFIKNVPEHMEKNAFQIPKNADTLHLVGELKTMHENKILNILDGAEEVFRENELNSSLSAIPKLQAVTFNNKCMVRVITTNDDYKDLNVEEKHEYDMLINFINFFKIFQQQFPKNLKDSPLATCTVDEILTAFASSLPVTEIPHRCLSQLDNENTNKSAAATTTTDTDEGPSVKKANTRSVNSIRLNRILCQNFMSLIVIFIMQEKKLLDEELRLDLLFTTDMLKLRNNIIRILGEMLNKLIEYLQYRSIDDNYIIFETEETLLPEPSFLLSDDEDDSSGTSDDTYSDFQINESRRKTSRKLQNLKLTQRQRDPKQRLGMSLKKTNDPNKKIDKFLPNRNLVIPDESTTPTTVTTKSSVPPPPPPPPPPPASFRYRFSQLPLVTEKIDAEASIVHFMNMIQYALTFGVFLVDRQ